MTPTAPRAPRAASRDKPRCSHAGCMRWGGWRVPGSRSRAWFCWEHRADAERRADR
jgi:hypothetical protein